MEKFLHTDFTLPANAAALFFILSSIVFLRYALLSGAYHYLVYRQFGRRNEQRVTHGGNFKPRQIIKEMYWSGISSVVFGVIGVVMIIAWQGGKTGIYLEPDAFPYWYLPVSCFLAMGIHETYYYWLHRWMHRPRVFRLLHKVHHESLETNAWTSFSFHPMESVLQAVIVPIIVFILPMHLYVLLFFLILMTVSAVINHAGIEVFPAGFHRHWLGKWLIGATHHDMHHKQFNKNYGLYFTFWDRWMGTENPDYADIFDARTAQKRRHRGTGAPDPDGRLA